MQGDADSTLLLLETNYANLSNLVVQIRMYLTEKLYHELTGSLITLMSDGSLSCGDKIQLFETVVHPLKDSLNILSFCTLLKLSCESLDPKSALEHLSKYDNFAEKEIEPYIMLQLAKSYHYVKDSQFRECDELLDNVKDTISNILNLDIPIYSAYYHASANMHKAFKNYSSCYKDYIMYLTYTSINDIPENERGTIAEAVTCSAILSPDGFGFGELIHQPIIEFYLKSSDNNWLYELLHIFNDGNIQAFDEFVEKGKILNQDLKSNEESLRKKLTLISLINLAFRKPNKQRCISFQEIMEHCNIKMDEVEPFILRALACKLVIGTIDQLQQVLQVSWVKPRILDTNKLDFIKQRIRGWISSTNHLVAELEGLTAYN